MFNRQLNFGAGLAAGIFRFAIFTAAAAVFCFFSAGAGAARGYSSGGDWVSPGYYSCDASFQDIKFNTAEVSAVRPQEVPESFSLQCNISKYAARHKESLTFGVCFGIGGQNTDQDGYLSMTHSDLNGNGSLPYRLIKDQNTVIGDGKGNRFPALYTAPAQTGIFSYSVNYLAVLGRADGYNLPTGFYRGPINPSISYGLRTDAKFPACGASGWPGRVPESLNNAYQASVILQSSCNVRTVSNINFGKFPDLRHVPPQTGIIEATCNDGTNYQLGIGPSRNLPNDPSRRAMKRDDGTELIYYNLYQDGARAQPWNTVWNSPGVKKDSGTGAAQQHIVYGMIEPNQETPPVGTYSDTVIVELRVDK